MPLLFGNYRRYVILVVCLIEMIFMSGVQYGWTSLVPVWKSMKVFSGQCSPSNETTAYATTPTTNNSSSSPTVVANKPSSDCPQQSFMLSTAFIVSSSCQFLFTLPCGILYDYIKLRFSKVCNAGFFLLACITMGLVSETRSYMLFIGGILFSAGAPFILMINFQIGAFFPQWQNLIVALFSGAFDSSSVVFQLVAFGYGAGISVLASFFILGWTAAVVMTFIAFFLFPRFNMTDHQPPLARPAEEPERPVEEQEMLEMNNGGAQDPPPPETAPTWKQVAFTREYIIQIVWFSIIFLRFQYFLSAMPMHLDYRFPTDKTIAPRLYMVLGLLLFCGIGFAPFAGLITDGLKKHFISEGQSPMEQKIQSLRAIGVGQALCTLSALLLTALIYVEGESIFYVLFILEVFTRAFLFSLNGAFSVTYYPGSSFGTLFGIMFLVGGIFSCIQFALLQISIIWSNAVILVLTIISFLQPLNLIFGQKCCR